MTLYCRAGECTILTTYNTPWCVFLGEGSPNLFQGLFPEEQFNQTISPANLLLITFILITSIDKIHKNIGNDSVYASSAERNYFRFALHLL